MSEKTVRPPEGLPDPPTISPNFDQRMTEEAAIDIQIS
jgi:hypothetical protein